MAAPISSRSVPILSLAWPLEPDLGCLQVPQIPGVSAQAVGYGCPFSFSASSPREAEHFPRHTGHLKVMDMAGCTKMLHLHRSHITSEKHREHHALLPGGWQRQQVSCVGTHTSVSRLTSTHTVTGSLSTAWPFCPFDAPAGTPDPLTHPLGP